MIVLAGGTGNLGERIARAIKARGGQARAIVRRGANPGQVSLLKNMGFAVVEVDFDKPDELARACAGATCVVSALSGLREVIVDAQKQLLEAALRAKVPRFIPSDFSLDYTALSPGSNRNFDLRREFRAALDRAPIQATSIFNGAFTEMITGQMPLILFKFKRVLFWENADQKMDFTTMDDTAAFTADVALGEAKDLPRNLHIAGDRVSARELVTIVSETDKTPYRLFRAGPLSRLEKLIKFSRMAFRKPRELYPPWQGMQYMHNMFSGRAGLPTLDNDRFGVRSWTTTRDILKKRT